MSVFTDVRKSLDGNFKIRVVLAYTLTEILWKALAHNGQSVDFVVIPNTPTFSAAGLNAVFTSLCGDINDRYIEARPRWKEGILRFGKLSFRPEVVGHITGLVTGTLTDPDLIAEVQQDSHPNAFRWAGPSKSSRLSWNLCRETSISLYPCQAIVDLLYPEGELREDPHPDYPSLTASGISKSDLQKFIQK